MATSNTSRLLSASTHLHPSFKVALRPVASVLPIFKGYPQSTMTHFCNLSSKPNAKSNIWCAMNMTAGQSNDPEKISLNHIMDKARKYWDSCPQPVKSFPWNRTLENFVQLILDLTLAVVKYLCVPLLAVSSLSEMSYCAHEKKLFFTPVPLFIGIFVAGILKETALELSPLLKVAEVPWHLIVIATFFTLLKLPGPYYPYWGRIFIPQFANGGLLMILWSAFLWYRRPQKTQETMLLKDSVNGTQYESNKL